MSSTRVNLHEKAKRALELMDLTSLNEHDTNESIIAMLDEIDAEAGLPAAICVYPQFVALCKAQLQQRGFDSVKVATVTNFPSGKEPLEAVLEQTRQAITDGADEIDLVMPYSQVMMGDPDTPWQYVRSSKDVCGDKVHLKVIIESGVLSEPDVIAQASDIAILAGADFIKTSTGKVPVNATLQAAEIMLSRIKANNKPVGFKAAGGVKTVAETLPYINAAESIMGASWVNAGHFRFGASSLLADIKAILAEAS
ncbi:deoxyribose-phosphate aldolase [Pseudoalteromonas luteoviolacea]|uniref:Deoxyribose-phosphate aldolase n=1 Tax=Pseudoalteromonas luteoviolacea TaxID=43657 RepID=A0A1C0TKV5_9GAMM|nr:deoxyribose-phosphate aldolase [Pseudoalteromonas luteoviolacea]MBQ4813211.1 deoxyribose-phosphate aldolase [Pseudoalteromonas luteoviolacea]OCQ19016.1 deoxyribose-phosphate aldolase [Pseudoalteromonas luteoviolacea]